jgi:tetratricopeptide (TPR) repeat protein
MRPLSVALIAIGVFGGAARADDVSAGLIRNAWYWQARARSDKAEDAWGQVLQAAPNDPQALAAIGIFHARAGRMQQARDTLARLEKLSPAHPDLKVLRRAIELGPRFNPLLSQARKLVHEGHADEGAARYRELFGDAGPPGDLALEYYQTLSGAREGWEQARDGLRRLVQRAPAEARFRLTLARLLTYRDPSRREGIESLATLARDPTVAKEASASWRQALLWLPGAPQDLPLLRAYERAHPGDPEIGALIGRSQKQGTVKQGFAAMDKGDLRSAEKLFKESGHAPEARRGMELIGDRRVAALKKQGFAALDRGELAEAEQLFETAGNDADARLGLALVAVRRATAAQEREDFAAATDLLERARQLAPQRRDLWESSLRSAKFWGLLRDGDEASLQEALQLAPPADRWHALLALADLAHARGQRGQAESAYREVLAQMPDQPDALRALTSILVDDGRFDEAQPLNERLIKSAPQKAFAPGALRAGALRAAAARSRATDLPRARRELIAAQQSDPRNVWVLHDLANVLLESGDPASAQPVVAALLEVAPTLPEAQVTEARLLAALGEEPQALAVLAALPPPLPKSVIELQRRLSVRVQIPALLAGDRAAAVTGLSQLQALVAADPELSAQVAIAWSRLGERERAVALMRAAMAQAPARTRGARLELASALLDASEGSQPGSADAEMGQLLDGLERDPSLSPPERKSLAELRIARGVRLADRERERGEPVAAAAALAPVLRDYPRDVRVVAAQARLIEREDPRRAHALYLALLEAAPADAAAARGAVDTALATGEVDEAAALSEEEVRVHPDDPRARVGAAHVALARDDDSSAMRELSAALDLLPETQISRNFDLSNAQPGSSGALLLAGAQRRAALPDTSLRTGILREMQGVRSRHRPSFGGAFSLRQRNGEPGLSQLSELRETLQAQTPLGYSARARLEISEIELDSGAMSAFAAPRFGTGTAATGSRQAFGTGLLATIESRHFDAFIGATPIGFRVLSVLGGVRGRGSLGPVSFAAEASRKTVTESVLSAAGERDPATGRSWGGVVMDGGRVDLGLALGAVHAWAYGEAHRLIGLSVADNRRIAGGGGVDLRLLEGDAGALSLGPTVSALGFDRNLRFFTFGQGGYFSPQRFVHGGLALTVRRAGALSFEAAAEPGYDAYIEAKSEILPLSRPGEGGAPYLGHSSGGASFNGHAQASWQISNDWELGLSAGILRAPEFQEVRAGVVLRFAGPR